MSNNQPLKEMTPEATIDQIINAEKKAGELLASIGLSIDKHKSETLRSVCQQKQWSEVEVLKWLKRNQYNNTQSSVEKGDRKSEFGDNISKWCDYLEAQFVTKNYELLDEINSDFHRVHKIHGNQYEWLKNIRWYLEKLEEKLRYYFYIQQRRLFPLLEELEDSKNKVLHGTISKINNGIKIIEEDHDEILNLIDTIEKKGAGFKNPEGACSTLRILIYNLKRLFNSLKKQIDIERKQLLPLVKQKLK